MIWVIWQRTEATDRRMEKMRPANGETANLKMAVTCQASYKMPGTSTSLILGARCAPVGAWITDTLTVPRRPRWRPSA